MASDCSGRAPKGKSPLEIAAWSVHLAEIHLLRQMELVEELRRDGHATQEAEKLLRLLEETLKAHEQALNNLLGTRWAE